MIASIATHLLGASHLSASEHLLGFGMPGPLEMAVIAIVLLLIFGPKRLPELAKAIGGSINIFKESMSGSSGRFVERDEDDEAAEKAAAKERDRSAAASLDDNRKADIEVPAPEVEGSEADTEAETRGSRSAD